MALRRSIHMMRMMIFFFKFEMNDEGTLSEHTCFFVCFFFFFFLLYLYLLNMVILSRANLIASK